MVNRIKTLELVVHCSATTPSQNIGVEEIRDWHVIDRHWRDIGYHFVVRRDGAIEQGRSIEEKGAHVKGHNDFSVGICLIGGIDLNERPENNYTEKQLLSLRILIDGLAARYPGVKVNGHRDYPGVIKDCPCFDVTKWYEGGVV